MRGLYTASLMNQLAAMFRDRRKDLNGSDADLDIGSAFDLIVGTSTGGILACALAHGIPIKDVVALYCDEGHLIFTDPMPKKVSVTSPPFLRWLVRNRKKAANKNDHLRDVLTKWFDKETLKGVYDRRKIALCLPSVKIIDEKSKVFKTPHHPDKRMDSRYSLVDVCLATSAAPFYLPLVALGSPHNHNNFDVFADGGLWANNPVLVGLIEALELTEPETPIQILSLGTCPAPEGAIVGKSALSRGVQDWYFGIKTLSLSMNAQAAGANFMAGLFAGIFGKYNKKIEIFRVKESAPSAEQITHLRLDMAGKDTIQALSSLGERDAINAYSSIHREGAEGRILTEIFEAMTCVTNGDDSKIINKEKVHV